MNGADLFGHETWPDVEAERRPPRPRDPFAGLTPFGYDLTMADPPWRFELYSAKGEAKSAQAHYDTMTVGEIAALPVGTLAAGDRLVWHDRVANAAPAGASPVAAAPVSQPEQLILL